MRMSGRRKNVAALEDPGTIKAAAADEGKPVSTWLAEAAIEKASAAAFLPLGGSRSGDRIGKGQHLADGIGGFAEVAV